MVVLSAMFIRDISVVQYAVVSALQLRILGQIAVEIGRHHLTEKKVRINSRLLLIPISMDPTLESAHTALPLRLNY